MNAGEEDTNESGEYTDYDDETDGFWSSEKTLLESMRSGDAAAVCRKRKKKKTNGKKENVDDLERCRKREAVASTGLWRRWLSFLQEHDEEWRGFWSVGRKCFVHTVRKLHAPILLLL